MDNDVRNTKDYVEVDFMMISVLLAAGVPVTRKSFRNGKLEYFFERTAAITALAELSRNELNGSWKDLIDEYKAIKKEWKDIQQITRR